MFSTLHLIAIAFTAISVPVFCMLIIKQGESTVVRVLKTIAVVCVFFDPAYWVWEWKTFGSLDFSTTLPLYLCSLFWLVFPFAMFARSERIKQIALACVATVVLLAGILGFVFNVHLNKYPFFSFVPIRSLLYHYLMIFTSVLLWTSKYYKPKSGDQWRAFVPLGILFIPALILNAMYGYDYCYTAGGVGTPIESVSALMPKPIFLIVLYGALVLFNWLVFYRKISIKSQKSDIETDSGDCIETAQASYIKIARESYIESGMEDWQDELLETN